MKQIPKWRMGVGNPGEFFLGSHATDIKTTAPGSEYSCAIHGAKFSQVLPHFTLQKSMGGGLSPPFH